MNESSLARSLQGNSSGGSQCISLLPPEIRAQITSYLSIYDLARMKNTGSKALWRSLCIPHAVSTLNVTLSPTSLKSWPVLLDEFRWITSLCFIDNIKSKHPFVGIRLDMMPKTLKKLKIKLPRDLWADFACAPDGTDTSLLRYVPNLEYIDINSRWEARGPWMGQMPPNLTFLKCLTWVRSHPLPPTLIHLKVKSIDDEKDLSETDFPMYLESLILDHTCPYLTISKLPQHLQHFECKHTKFEPDWIDQLPRTLTSLILPRTSFKDSKRPACLPPRLTNLSANTVSPSIWKFLPSGLTTLKMAKVDLSPPTQTVTIANPQNGRTRNIEVLALSALPATLTQVIVNDHPQNHHYWLAYAESVPPTPVQHAQLLFPTSLVSLEAERWRITTSAAKLLPPTLTTLHTFHLDAMLCKLLPRRLQTLLAHSAVLSMDLIQNLPPTLTSLTLEFYQNYMKFIDEFTGESVQYLGLEGPEARSWRIGEYRLPRTLTSLTWSRAFVGRDFFVQKNLEHLKYLNLRFCYVDWVDEAISHLPRSLTSFQLGGNTGLTGKCFSQLPRGLTYLSVETLEDIDDEDIKHLPRGITTLDLTRAHNLTNVCVKDLPPAVTLLAMICNRRITIDAYPDLPASLKQADGMFWTGEWSAYDGSAPQPEHRTLLKRPKTKTYL